MTKEEKQLLLQDLCTRLPYKIRVKVSEVSYPVEFDVQMLAEIKNNNWYEYPIPYLRPISSMTEEEKREFQSFFPGCFGDQWLDIEEGTIEIFECSSTMTLYLYDFERMIDWLNKNHFDYRGLIKKGLAIEESEGMYNITK